MNIGYACITTGLLQTGLRSCTQKTATEEHLGELIRHNLNILEQQVDYNIRRDIKLFRLSSDLIPFGSSPINNLAWWAEYKDTFTRIGSKITTSGMRVSMHPGQYTVLTSRDEDVSTRAAQDLSYHARVLDALGVGYESKIVLHIGGVYGDKAAATERFAKRFTALPDTVQKRLVIENDERCYHIADVLKLADRLAIPAVYDNLHNFVYPADESKDDSFWIQEAAATWKPHDGRQKIHYAQQEPAKRPGAHAQRIRLTEFLSFVQSLDGLTPDIMLEVKDKDLSAIKCKNALSSQPHIKLLEEEWARYKYLILEKDPNIYQQIRVLLKQKDAYPVEAFYALIDTALEKETTVGTFENAALHVWGYFKNKADSTQKAQFTQAIKRLRNGTLSMKAVKRNLWKLAVQYHESYLLESFFFID